MLTLKNLEDLCAVARTKGAHDDLEVKFCASDAGVAANAKISINPAANISIGSFVENAGAETVLQVPELVLNQ